MSKAWDKEDLSHARDMLIDSFSLHIPLLLKLSCYEGENAVEYRG